MEKNEEYKRKLEAQLKEWTAHLEELKARSERLGAEARVEVERKIEALRSRRGEVRERLDALRDGGEEAWGHLRTGLEKAMEDLKKGVSEALSAVRPRSGEGEGDVDAEDATKPEICVTADVPEHARFQDDGLPCDDGRGGDI